MTHSDSYTNYSKCKDHPSGHLERNFEPLDKDICDKWRIIAADIQQAANSITMSQSYHLLLVSEFNQHLDIFCDAS